MVRQPIGQPHQSSEAENRHLNSARSDRTGPAWDSSGDRHRHIEAMTGADGRTYVDGEMRAEAINPQAGIEQDVT